MKTWKKIGIGLLVVLVSVVVYFYIIGSSTSTDTDTRNQENPIFPFEGGDDSDFFSDDTSDEDTDDSSDQPQQEPPSLWQISDRPIAGSQWVESDKELEQIWHVRKENGHLYQTDPADRESTRLTNTTIPRVQEALISPQGDYIIYRYLDEENNTVKTYLANLSASESSEIPYQTGGEFLPDNITTAALSPSGDEVFYLQKKNNGVVGVIYNISEDADQIVFQSQVKEWRGQWSSEKDITLFTKPSRNAKGFAYRINSDTGELIKLAEGNGLIASLSPNGEYVLTSFFENGQYRGRLRSVSDQQTTLMSPKTMADKCSWVENQGVLLCAIPNNLSRNPVKDWYQGRISFLDTLTLFNPISRDNRVLFTYDELDEGSFDISNIESDDSLNNLIFENRKTGILWGYEL